MKFPDKAKAARDRHMKAYRKRIKPLGYIVELDEEIFSIDISKMKVKGEYGILKELRKRFNNFIREGREYSVFRRSHSYNFDKVPHEPDETQTGEF